MHYKPIQEGHMCNLVLKKDLDLAASGSFYYDCTHMIVTKNKLLHELKVGTWDDKMAFPLYT
jgi:hypothetical protein